MVPRSVGIHPVKPGLSAIDNIEINRVCQVLQRCGQASRTRRRIDTVRKFGDEGRRHVTEKI